MRHRTRSTVPTHRNPALLPGLVALEEFLIGRNYGQGYREDIRDHVALTGELAGAVAKGLLEADDEPDAEAAFVEALPDVPDDSPAWDAPEVILDVAMLAEGTHPIPCFPQPIAGGAPDHEAMPHDLQPSTLERVAFALYGPNPYA